MALKDTHTGAVRVTRRFRARHGAAYAQRGIDLRRPFPSEGHLISALVEVHLPEAAQAALARHLGLIE